MPQLVEFNLFDEFTGEQQFHSIKRKKSNLGGGWVAFYKKALKKLVNDVPNLSTLRVYLLLATKQTYQKFVMTTQVQVQKELNMSNSTVYEALKWLKDNKYIQQHNVEGNIGYLLNADVTNCGGANKTKKKELWLLQEKRDEIIKLDEHIEKRQQILEKLDSLIMGLTTDPDADEEDEDE